MKVPFSPPDISEAEVAAVSSALRSGWITTGPRTKELERRIADYVGTKYACCLNSQTACGEMALRILDIGPGDEVIVPAYTYTATASVVCHVGATLKMADCKKDSLQMDYEQVASLITEKTKAIIAVDLGGIPCDYDRLFEIAEEKRKLFRPQNAVQTAMGRVAIIADTAHALGAKIGERAVGSVADFSAFSFHAVKNITTAEGGVLTWRTIPGVEDEEIYRKLQLFSLHGQSKDALAKNQPGSWEYDVVGPWYKCNMTDIAAAMGLAQMDRYPGMLERRKDLIAAYDKALKPVGVEVLAHYTDSYTSSGHLYITKIPGITAQQRNEIICRMAEKEIACNVHYKPLPMHTAYKNLGFCIEDYPNAYAHFCREITLPLHTCLTDGQQAYVIENFLEILKDYR